MRPATIVGDSLDGRGRPLRRAVPAHPARGHSPPDLALPLPGRGDEPLNLVPIDWVARASRRARARSRARAGARSTWSIPAPLTARRVFELVARAGGRRGPRGSIPANLAKALLRAPGLERIAKSPRAFLETLTTPVTYDARNADELLSSLGVPPCPPLESYVDRLVEYVQERVRAAARREHSGGRARVESRGSAWLGRRCRRASARAWSSGGWSCRRATSSSSRAWSRRARGSLRCSPSRGGDLIGRRRPRAARRSSTRCSTSCAPSCGGVRVDP